MRDWRVVGWNQRLSSRHFLVTTPPPPFGGPPPLTQGRLGTAFTFHQMCSRKSTTGPPGTGNSFSPHLVVAGDSPWCCTLAVPGSVCGGGTRLANRRPLRQHILSLSPTGRARMCCFGSFLWASKEMNTTVPLALPSKTHTEVWPLFSLRMTSCAPPSMILVEDTSVSLAFCCNSLMLSAPQLHMVERILLSVRSTFSLSGPA